MLSFEKGLTDFKGCSQPFCETLNFALNVENKTKL